MSKISIEGNSLGTGTLTIAAPNTSTDRTLTLPDNTGTIITTASTFAGTGPAFYAHQSTTQTPTTSTWTKIQLPTEVFDTANCFDNSTNYRFTPNVAGYYQINGQLRYGSASGFTCSNAIVAIYKNGSEYFRLSQNNFNVSATSQIGAGALIYFNGSTDYVELYGFLTNSSGTTSFFNDGQPYACSMSGALVRAA